MLAWYKARRISDWLMWPLVLFPTCIVVVFLAISVVGEISWQRQQNKNVAIMECETAYDGDSPSGRFYLDNDNPCRFSPCGTVLRLYDTREPHRGVNDAEFSYMHQVLNVRYGGPIRTEWLSDKRLRVTCESCDLENAVMRKKLLGVEIEFHAIGGPLRRCWPQF
jgi:hypothetical protein